MSMAAQKAWYKKHGMEMPSATATGRSAAQAKKDIGEINKKKARETAIAAAAASKKNKELMKSSERVRQMAANVKAFGGQRPGGDLTTASGMVNYIRSGGYLKAGRLGEETIDEVERINLIKRAAVANRMGKAAFLSKVNARAAQITQQKKDDKITKSKANYGMSNEPVDLGEAVVKTKEVNKQKLKNYVRGLGTKAVIAGKVPFDQVHSPLRAGRKVLKQEEKKPDASMAMTHTLKMKAMSDKDKRTLGKVAALMAAQKKKVKEEFESIDEVTKKEAEAALGGPVREKPKMPSGKQPAGYRYVRNLARRAMKAGLKKEEVELVEETIDETYQSKYSGYPLARTKYVTKTELKAREKDKKLRTTSDYKDHVARLKKVKHLKKMVDDIHNNMQMDFWSSKSGNKSNPIDDATHKRLLNRINSLKEEIELAEASKDTADVGEYDYEGDMAKSQLRSILANAKRLHDMLEDQTNLPEWVQSKITLAEDYILTAANYMEGEMNEETLAALEAELVEEIELFEKAPPGSKYERMVKHIKKGYAKGGLTPQEKSIAYATAWKAYNKANEEVEQLSEGPSHYQYSGTIHSNVGNAKHGEEKDDGHSYSITIPTRGAHQGDLGSFLSSKKAFSRISRENPHLEPHHVLAVMHGTGDDVEDVEVDHKGKTYKHRLYNNQEPDYLYEEVEQMEEGKGYAPGWMLKKDKNLGAKVKEKIDLAKKRQASYGKPEAGVSVKEEAEGKLAVTPKEKDLAAHHGDKTRITYGDVIKARLKSAAAKAMKKGN